MHQQRPFWSGPDAFPALGRGVRLYPARCRLALCAASATGHRLGQRVDTRSVTRAARSSGTRSARSAAGSCPRSTAICPHCRDGGAGVFPRPRMVLCVRSFCGQDGAESLRASAKNKSRSEAAWSSLRYSLYDAVWRRCQPRAPCRPRTGRIDPRGLPRHPYGSPAQSPCAEGGELARALKAPSAGGHA